MRGARFFGLVLFFVITYISLPSTLQAASEWNDTVINRQIDFPSNPDTREMGTCAYFDTNKVLLKEIETQNSPLISYKYTNTTEEILQPLGDYCLTRSNAGYHWPGFWAPDLDTPEKMYELRNTQGDLWFAPNSDSYLYLQPYPRITYARYLSFNSGFKAGTNGKFTTRTIGSGVSALEQKGFTVDPASFTDAYRYSDNQYVVLSFQGIWFSANGRYAAVMVYGQGFAMIDLQTRSYTPFAISKSTTMPFLDINVDSYGRYVVVDSGLPVVYDLTLCTSYSDGNWPSNGFANLPATCVPSYNSAADLVPYTSNYTKSLGSWITPDGLRFIHDRTNPATGQNIRLEFYPASRANSLGEPNGAEGYLAMGDSYSSGEGAYDYEPGTDEKGDISTYAERNMCHISRKSYSYLLAMELGYLLDNSSQPPADGLFHSVACSGAKTHNIIGSPLGEKQSDGTQEEFTSTNNQYRFSASSLMEEWQSGISTQESFLHPGLLPDNLNRKGYSNPEQITLGIGGNDAFFSDFIQACIFPSSPGTCPQAEPGTAEHAQTIVRIAKVKPKLVKAYLKLKQSAPESRIYILGYPTITSPTANDCHIGVLFNATEREFIFNTTKYLNQIIKAAADEAGVFYVNVEDTFNGYWLCSNKDPGLIAVNGLDIETDTDLFGLCPTECIGNSSYHPNQLGHQLYESQILLATSNLTQPMPEPTASPTPLPDSVVFGNDARDAVVEALADEYSIDPLKLTYPDPGTPSQISKEITGLMPGSVVDVYVHSTPQLVFSGQVDTLGKLTVGFSLPDNLEPGSHEIVIDAVDIYGKKHQYIDSFLLGFDQQDFDGDGIVDTIDSCILVPNSGQDTDRDGIDDICDLNVGAEKLHGNSGNNDDPADPSNLKPQRDVSVITPALSLTNKVTQLFAAGVSAANSAKSTAGNKSTKVLGAQSDNQTIANPENSDTSTDNKLAGHNWMLFLIVLGLFGAMVGVTFAVNKHK